MREYKMVSLILSLFILAASCTAQDVETENIPDEVLPIVETGRFAESFAVNGGMNPFYLRGDFDGDHKPDYAMWTKAKNSGQVGIAVWLSSKKDVVILGAGRSFLLAGATVTSLNSINFWKVFQRGPVEQGVATQKPPRLVGDAILAGKRESASGLLYWTGTRFVWYQQGD